MYNKNLNAIYITGLSASGKTTLAYKLISAMRTNAYNIMLLDGTELYNQSILYPFKGHDIQDRKDRASHHIRMVKWISSQSILPIVAFIGQPLSIRNGWSDELDDWKEIYLKCDIKTCIRRDNKSLYSSNQINKTASIIGIDNNFDEPINPWLTINTSICSEDEVKNIAWQKIKSIDWLHKYKLENNSTP